MNEIECVNVSGGCLISEGSEILGDFLSSKYCQLYDTNENMHN